MYLETGPLSFTFVYLLLFTGYRQLNAARLKRVINLQSQKWTRTKSNGIVFKAMEEKRMFILQLLTITHIKNRTSHPVLLFSFSGLLFTVGQEKFIAVEKRRWTILAFV
jgi:hypothetical protein